MHYCSLLVVVSSMGNDAPTHMQLPPCKVFLAPSTIPGTGFGGFAGRAFEQDEMVSATWKTLFLPKNFPHSQAVNNYVFAYNETHMGLPLDYGPVFNHHENANVEASKDPRPQKPSRLDRKFW